jgi:hypothetical protein
MMVSHSRDAQIQVLAQLNIRFSHFCCCRFAESLLTASATAFGSDRRQMISTLILDLINFRQTLVIGGCVRTMLSFYMFEL